jgi:hypothetical protein
VQNRRWYSVIARSRSTLRSIGGFAVDGRGIRSAYWLSPQAASLGVTWMEVAEGSGQIALSPHSSPPNSAAGDERQGYGKAIRTMVSAARG